MSEGTIYAWKAKLGGMSVSDAQRLTALGDENRRLKKLLAESMLEVSALKDLRENVWAAPFLQAVEGCRKQSA